MNNGPQDRSAAPVACVIICSYNRAKLLERALRSLARQTLSPDRFELVVVDDGSSDATASVCESLRRDGLPNLKCVRTGHAGLASARNTGVRSTTAERILFMDDDCVAAPDWVERMIAALGRHPVIAGAVATSRDSFCRLCHNISQFYAFMPTRKPGPVDFIAGANMGFHRMVIQKVGGFEDNIRAAEDMEFILRARGDGYRPCFAPEAIVTHLPDRGTLAEIIRYAARHAESTILLRQQHRRILRTPFLLCSPALLLAGAPLISFKVTAGVYMGDRKLLRLWWTAPVVYATKLAWCVGAARALRRYRKEPSEVQP
jgi:glycosyltransferase involved in cell wall biosynthesis